MTTDTPTKKARLFTPQELEFAEQLEKALIGKATAAATLDVCRREIGRVTQEINKLPYARGVQVWAEALEKVGASPAPTREQLTKGT